MILIYFKHFFISSTNQINIMFGPSYLRWEQPSYLRGEQPHVTRPMHQVILYQLLPSLIDYAAHLSLTAQQAINTYRPICETFFSTLRQGVYLRAILWQEMGTSTQVWVLFKSSNDIQFGISSKVQQENMTLMEMELI